MFAGAIVPRTSQYGAGAPVVLTAAAVIVTGASVTPDRSRPVTAAQSITGATAGSTARPSAPTGGCRPSWSAAALAVATKADDSSTASHTKGRCIRNSSSERTRRSP